VEIFMPDQDDKKITNDFRSILGFDGRFHVGNPEERFRVAKPGGFGVRILFLRFLKDESGATAIEYGLIAAGIALAIIAVVNSLRTTLNAKFAAINTSLK
jgi:pilus assembly protein Flp/PilA